MNRRSGAGAEAADVVVAFDTGGTFTDVAVVSAKGFAVAKQLSTPDAPADAIILAVNEALNQLGLKFADVEALRGATTVIINALIEYRGVATALLTTDGFTDLLEMRREHRYDNYDIQIELPKAYVPRYLCYGIEERVDAEGTVVRALNVNSVVRATEELRREGVESVAVCLLHSYRFAEHERQIGEILAERCPDMAMTLSCELAPEIREYERMSTTVVNAYTQPIMRRHLDDIRGRLEKESFGGEFTFMTSSGRMRGTEFVAAWPAHALESGPAAGAIAAAHIGRTAGYRSIISFDMGGTTAKICVMPDGAPAIARSFEIARTKRFHIGSGHPVRLPTVDLLEIGAGGGSLARVDQLGLMQVGPESAGAVPGPACYSRGGVEATVTDANLLLGYLDTANFLGGDMAIDVDASRTAIERLATLLELDVVKTAWWIHGVVNNNMARAMRVHVAEKGVDAKKFTLVSFGGAAGLHVGRVAHEVGIGRIICPPCAGVASAFGLLVAPPGADAVISAPGRLSDVEPSALRSALDKPLANARDALLSMGVPEGAIAVSLSADMRYSGQAMEIEVAIPALPLEMADESWLTDVRMAYEQQYERLYGRTFEHLSVEVMNWRLAITDTRESTLWPSSRNGGAATRGARPAFLPELGGYVETPTCSRGSLKPGWQEKGPFIIEERESTIIVPPFASVEVDEYHNVVMSL